jgi:alkylation response protein AidB-like acyl-CoA dehydrogenase
MDFALDEELRMFQKMFRDFAQNEIAPLAETLDREERPPLETLNLAAEQGFLGAPFPEEYGGSEIGTIGYCMMLEEIGKVCMSTAMIIEVHTSIAAMCIYLDGTEEQKRTYLEPLSLGEKMGSFALTEPGAGSDAAGVQTTAVRDGDDYILNGNKIWIINGSIAGTFVVFAKTDPEKGARGITAFIVEKGTPGLTVSRNEKMMGLRGVPVAALFFDDCRVPASNVLGGEEKLGQGFVTAMKALDYGRLSVGAICLGVAQGALEAGVQFACEREQFGVPIALKQAIQNFIADAATEIEALRYLVYHTAWRVDQGRKYTKEAAMVKLFGAEVAGRVVNNMLQTHGGYGYIKDYPIERMYRDVRASRIFEGTSEIQRFVIAADIIGEKGLKVRP